MVGEGGGSRIYFILKFLSREIEGVLISTVESTDRINVK